MLYFYMSTFATFLGFMGHLGYSGNFFWLARCLLNPNILDFRRLSFLVFKKSSLSIKKNVSSLSTHLCFLEFSFFFYYPLILLFFFSLKHFLMDETRDPFLSRVIFSRNIHLFLFLSKKHSRFFLPMEKGRH